MSAREYEEQRIHDKITLEERQEEAMDRKLISDNMRLAQRLQRRG